MSKKRIAINGFGRIGRLTLRKLMGNSSVEVVAINDLTDVETLTYLFKRDSVHGTYPGDVRTELGRLFIDEHSIAVLSERDPAKLPWAQLEIDLVIECTGIFRDREGAGKHLTAGAKRVVISAPAQGDIPTVVLGVNDEILTGEETIVSNASCTTNCLAPMVKVLDQAFGIQKGFITTIHAYTADQSLQDSPHSDLRRARAAAVNMVPTSTGAAKAVGKVLPALAGRLDGIAVRVPIPTGSITDFVAVLDQEVTKEQINAVFKKAATDGMEGIVDYCVDPIVSSDIVGDSHSCIFDSELTSAQGNLVKVFGWYDNEMGYASRLAQLAEAMCTNPESVKS